MSANIAVGLIYKGGVARGSLGRVAAEIGSIRLLNVRFQGAVLNARDEHVNFVMNIGGTVSRAHSVRKGVSFVSSVYIDPALRRENAVTVLTFGQRRAMAMPHSRNMRDVGNIELFMVHEDGTPLELAEPQLQVTFECGLIPDGHVYYRGRGQLC